MEPEEKRRKRNERYEIRVEIRKRVEERGGKEIAKGARRRVGSKIKRKETALGGCGGENFLLEWRTDDDMPSKRHGIEEMVSSRDISSDTSTDLDDEFFTPCMLRSATTL
jgi:hypothetical protein